MWAARKNSGFTIVELLIVVVVIGILAAIVIVAYGGIQAQARTAAGKALANTVAKKAEVFKTHYGRYPRTCEWETNIYGSSGAPCAGGSGSIPEEARLSDPNIIIYSNTSDGSDHSLNDANNNKRVSYHYCSGAITEANIYYLDFSNSNAVIKVGLNGGC